MKEETVYIPKECDYLSDYIDVLPGNCILDKGMCGCGGTTLELTSKRNSLILVPTINLVLNKAREGILGVTGDTEICELIDYLKSDVPYKKIMCTYDSFRKVIDKIGKDFFLLVDEYHVLFLQYKFRNKAIRYLLDNYSKFDEVCFMSATPLTENNVLKEISSLPVIRYRWIGKLPVQVNYIPTAWWRKELHNRILECLNSDYNLHIFLNSFMTIKYMVNKLPDIDYRVVCSKYQRDKSSLNYQGINSKVRKVNFYTSTAFEGTDIFDKKGKTIVVSDTNITCTVSDISVLLPQIAGRLRDSIYLNQIEYIFSAVNHRYYNKTKREFDMFVMENERQGNISVGNYESLSVEGRMNMMRIVSDDLLMNFYVGRDDDGMYLDPNLKNIDMDNFRQFNELKYLYTQRPSEYVPESRTAHKDRVYKSRYEELAYKVLQLGKPYTRDLLDRILLEKGILNNAGMWNRFIVDNFSSFKKERKSIGGKNQTVYTFY